MDNGPMNNLGSRHEREMGGTPPTNQNGMPLQNIQQNKRGGNPFRWRRAQSYDMVRSILTEQEMAMCPTLKQALNKLFEEQYATSQISQKIEELLRNKAATKENKLQQYHDLLDQEEKQKEKTKIALRFLVENADKITSEVSARRDTLRKELRSTHGQKAHKNDSKPGRNLNLLYRIYTQIEENIPEIDENTPEPLRILLTQRMTSYMPQVRDINTTAMMTFMPQVRELRFKLEQLSQEISEVDSRISEIEDIMMTSEKK